MVSFLMKFNNRFFFAGLISVLKVYDGLLTKLMNG